MASPLGLPKKFPSNLLAFLKHRQDFRFGDLPLIMDQCVFQNFVCSTRDFGVAKPISRRRQAFPPYPWRRESHEAMLQQFQNLTCLRKFIVQYVVEPAKKRRVENLRVIRRSNNKAVRVILLDHLQKTVKHTPNLPNVIRDATLGTDGVELVKEINAPRMVRCIEDLPQLRSSFPHKFC